VTLDLAEVDLAARTVAVIGKGKSEKVRNREQILPTGVPKFFHPIAAQHPLLDLVAGVHLVADVLIVSLDAPPQADLHHPGSRWLWLLLAHHLIPPGDYPPDHIVSNKYQNF
jgi:hypothetical protein